MDCNQELANWNGNIEKLGLTTQSNTLEERSSGLYFLFHVSSVVFVVVVVNFITFQLFVT